MRHSLPNFERKRLLINFYLNNAKVTLMSAFPHIPSEGAETVTPIIQKVAELPYMLGNVKVIS